MARNDGIDRTFARNQDLPTLDDVAKVQEHNEREKDSYSNQDIDTTQTYRNIHFKAPTDSYAAMFDQMIADGVISTRGLKADAVKYGELIFDVNSAYFHNHGGYEYAKQFYTDAYKAAVEIVGGEQYILSAVMHADERNRAMSEALGQDVYHYHLHVVYVPVVEKQILWSKRCKDKSLVGTVKETIMQVSRSKKWESKVALDEQGNPLLTSKGKKVLRTSYSVLQDDFFNYMKAGNLARRVQDSAGRLQAGAELPRRNGVASGNSYPCRFRGDECRRLQDRQGSRRRHDHRAPHRQRSLLRRRRRGDETRSNRQIPDHQVHRHGQCRVRCSYVRIRHRRAGRGRHPR